MLQKYQFLQQPLYFLFLSTISANKYVIIRKNPRFFPNLYFSSNHFFEQYKKSPVMRGQTCFCQHYGIFRAATGGLLTPRTPVAHLAATSSARCLAFLTLERAHTRPYTDLRKAQIRPHTPGGFAHLRSASRNLSARFAGMYPANCPPIRSRP